MLGYSICLVGVPGGLAEAAAAAQILGRSCWWAGGYWSLPSQRDGACRGALRRQEGSVSAETGLTLVLKCFQMPFMHMVSPSLLNSSGRWAALLSHFTGERKDQRGSVAWHGCRDWAGSRLQS